METKYSGPGSSNIMSKPSDVAYSDGEDDMAVFQQVLDHLDLPKIHPSPCLFASKAKQKKAERRHAPAVV